MAELGAGLLDFLGLDVGEFGLFATEDAAAAAAENSAAAAAGTEEAAAATTKMNTAQLAASKALQDNAAGKLEGETANQVQRTWNRLNPAQQAQVRKKLLASVDLNNAYKSSAAGDLPRTFTTEQMGDVLGQGTMNREVDSSMMRAATGRPPVLNGVERMEVEMENPSGVGAKGRGSGRFERFGNIVEGAKNAANKVVKRAQNAASKFEGLGRDGQLIEEDDEAKLAPATAADVELASTQNAPAAEGKLSMSDVQKRLGFGAELKEAARFGEQTPAEPKASPNLNQVAEAVKGQLGRAASAARQQGEVALNRGLEGAKQTGKELVENAQKQADDIVEAGKKSTKKFIAKGLAAQTGLSVLLPKAESALGMKKDKDEVNVQSAPNINITMPQAPQVPMFPFPEVQQDRMRRYRRAETARGYYN